MKKFDQLFNAIIESLGPVPATSGNLAGSGGALGTFQTSNWQNNPAGTPGTDTYNTGDIRKPVALGAKKRRGKISIPVQRRFLSKSL